MTDKDGNWYFREPPGYGPPVRKREPGVLIRMGLVAAFWAVYLIWLHASV